MKWSELKQAVDKELEAKYLEDVDIRDIDLNPEFEYVIFIDESGKLVIW